MTKPLPPDLTDNAPWKQRYQTRGTTWTALAKERPERGLTCSNRSGIYQLYAWNVPTGDLQQITDEPTGKSFGMISPDGSHIYYLDDHAGDEIGHHIRVPFEGGDPQDLTPDLPPYSSWSIEVSRTGNLLGFVAADDDGFHLYTLNLAPIGEVGTPDLLHHSTKLLYGPALSRSGDLAVLTTTEFSSGLDYGLLAFDTATGDTIAQLWDGDDNSIQAVMFSPLQGDTRLLAHTTITGSVRPLLWDPRSGTRTDLDLEELQGDVVPFDWSQDAERLLLCHFSQAVQKLYIYDLPNNRLVPVNHPEGSYGFFAELGVYFGPNNEIFAQWQDSANPSRPIALDPQSGNVRTLIQPAEVPPGRPWKSVTFTSSDGQQIQAWLGLPDGDAPFPTILHTHGGPESVTTQLFAPGSQSWLDHGYAFLTINYRGSTTFGREFQQQIRGNPGHWEIEDMRAAHDWLVDSGIARPDQILVTGGSYGGYLTLLALGKLPDLFAGGMGLVAIADWVLEYEDEAETLRGYDRALFGGSPDEMPEEYAASSPITYAEKVRAPLLIIQGRNDTRCPGRQVEVYEAKMRELGKPIEVQWFDAGHGSLDIEQQISQQAEMLKFAYRVTGVQGPKTPDGGLGVSPNISP
jgi:dipeptidyl aminopeptidase/acylaminoacyl peptidase